MKKFTRLTLIALVTLLLVAFTPLSVNGDPKKRDLIKSPTAQEVIYQGPELDFRFIRAGKDSSPEYRFIAKITLCNQFLDVQGVTIYSATDSTHLPCIRINKIIQQSNGCLVELFLVGIHGGALAAQLKKDGLSTIIIHGAENAMTFELTGYGEETLLRIILGTRESTTSN